ncbi:unnamed protein product, partial [Ectocarpus sp. 4 AP-2014]
SKSYQIKIITHLPPHPPTLITTPHSPPHPLVTLLPAPPADTRHHRSPPRSLSPTQQFPARASTRVNHEASGSHHQRHPRCLHRTAASGSHCLRHDLLGLRRRRGVVLRLQR